MAQYDQYTWVFAISSIFSFICAFGIGANDLANSFGSSVGAKAITISQAVLIAAVCEFAGAVGLGSGVTSTIKSGITSVSQFKTSPDILLFGMFCVMIASAFWDNLACRLELPVSTTHTTVGAIIGMAMVTRGSNAVVWSKKKDDFPYVDGLVPIFISWFMSPIMAGIAVLILYGFIRTFILRSKNSFQRGFYLLPVFVFLTFFLITLFIIQTGNKNKSWGEQIPDSKAVWISVVVGFPLALFTLLLVMPVLKRWIDQEEASREEAKEKALAIEEGKGGEPKSLAELELENPPTRWQKIESSFTNFADNTRAGNIIFRNPVSKVVLAGITADVHESVVTNETVGRIWEDAEVFDWKTEALFRYLQVFSAMTMSFAHGANDVANAVGPFAAVYAIWKNGEVPGSSSPVPTWIYVMGGAGIVCGLATYGHYIMRVLGVKVSKMTNSRGFAAELSTATVVLVASRFGLPVSTTQTITGAIIAIGLFEGAGGVNWIVVLKTFLGWVMTLIIAAFVAAAFVSFGVFAPSKLASDNILAVNKVLANEVIRMTAQLNASSLATTISTNITEIVTAFIPLNGTKSRAYIYPQELAALQLKTLNLFNSTLAA